MAVTRELAADRLAIRVGTVEIDCDGSCQRVLKVLVDGKTVLAKRVRMVMDPEKSQLWQVTLELLPFKVPEELGGNSGNPVGQAPVPGGSAAAPGPARDV